MDDFPHFATKRKRNRNRAHCVNISRVATGVAAERETNTSRTFWGFGGTRRRHVV